MKGKLLEASTGIEPVYTDLQSAASPLRQLASEQGWDSLLRGAVQASFRWKMRPFPPLPRPPEYGITVPS